MAGSKPTRIPEEEDGESESATRFKLPQYSLRTLIIVVTGAAVLLSLFAWLGFFAVFILGGALGVFLGLLLCSALGFSFAFDDLRWDVPKCFIVAFATIAPFYFLPYLIDWTHADSFASILYLFTPIFCYWLSMTTAWHDLELPEIFVTALVSFFTWAAVAYAASVIAALIARIV
jgi:hypothetical protein